jgi:hypothetical protein
VTYQKTSECYRQRRKALSSPIEQDWGNAFVHHSEAGHAILPQTPLQSDRHLKNGRSDTDIIALGRIFTDDTKIEQIATLYI